MKRNLYFLILLAGLFSYCTGSAQNYLFVDPTVLSIGPSSATGLVGTVTSNVSWQVTEPEAWITNLSPASGTNNGTFTFSVTENTGNSRTGIITITDVSGSAESVTITVVQAGATGSYLLVDPVTLNVGPSANTGLVGTVTSNVSWQVTESETWITNLNPASGTNNGTFTFSVTENTGAVRTGTITISDVSGSVQPVTITVVQSSPSDFYMLLDPISQSVISAGETLVANVFANVSWEVIANVNWIVDINPPSGSNDGAFAYTVQPNSDPNARTGVITLRAVGVIGLPDQLLTVIQEGTVSIDEIAEKSTKITLYPNPFADNLVVNFTNVMREELFNMLVYSSNGELVYEQENIFVPFDQHAVTWNGCDKNGERLQTGWYSVVIKNTQEIVFSSKVILVNH